MSSSGLQTARRLREPRIAPSPLVALGVIVAYAVVFTVVAIVPSGIPYADWFATGASTFRTAVLPLMAGAVVLVVFLWWARWDFVFRDPERLPMRRFYWAAVAVFVVAIVLHLVFVRWERLTPGLLLAVLAAGVLVGFCEETLFRGILLRSLRNGRRSEALCLVLTSVIFGLFHLSNLLNGSPVGAVASSRYSGLDGRDLVSVPTHPGSARGGDGCARAVGHLVVPARWWRWDGRCPGESCSPGYRPRGRHRRSRRVTPAGAQHGCRVGCRRQNRPDRLNVSVPLWLRSALL